MTFYNDSFKTAGGTLLAGMSQPYVSDSGATYTAHPQFSLASAKEIAAGTRMRPNAATPNVFLISRAAPSSDHSMTCKVYVASLLNAESTGVLCRLSPTLATWYSLAINSGQVQLWKAVNATYMQLGNNVGIGESIGATFNLILTCLGSLITGAVTRDSDGFYLTSTGAWQAAPANVFAFVDVAVPTGVNVGLYIGALADDDSHGYQMASASGSGAPLAPTSEQVLDPKAGFGAQGLVRGSVATGSISGNTNALTSSGAGFLATDVGLDICVVSGNSMPPGSNTAFVSPPVAAPTLCMTSGGTVTQTTTYYVTITYKSATGETLPSPESTLMVPPNNLLVVKQPTPSGTGWNVYVSAQLQTPGAPNLTLCCTGGSLPASTTYRYKITAVDIHHPLTGATAETAASGENSMMTSTTSTNSIALSWTAVQRAVAYNIYRTSGGANTETFLTQVPGNLTSYADTGAVTPGTAQPPGSDTGTGTGREILQGPPPGPNFNGDWQEASNGLIPGPGALITKILSFTDSSHVTLAYSWPFTASPTNAAVTWGIDDTNAFQGALDEARSGPNRAIISIPAGQYMITRRLGIPNPVSGGAAGGLVIEGAGNLQPDYFPSGNYTGISCKSVIVWAGPANQPMLQISNSINIAFRDMALWGPATQYPSVSSSYGVPVAGIQLINDAANIFIENVTIGSCSTGLLMDYGSGGNSDITSDHLTITNCINFGLRVMINQGLNFWMRSFYVGSDATNNQNFVAAQFDMGGWLYWLGGNLTSVPTVLGIGPNGAGPNAANFVIDGVRIDTNTPNQRCTIVDTSNGGVGVIGTNTIAVRNLQLNSTIGDGTHALFNLGPNTNLTVASTTLFQTPLANMVSSATGDTTLVLENVNYALQLPFAAAIKADPGSYWRSRNCRINSMLRFDESTWTGDGVVAPFRNNCLGLVDSNNNVLCRAYFRPGNRQQNRIANEFPYQLSVNAQLVYGTCTGVFSATLTPSGPRPRCSQPCPRTCSPAGSTGTRTSP